MMENQSTPSPLPLPPDNGQKAGQFAVLRPPVLNGGISKSSKSKRQVSDTSLEDESDAVDQHDFKDRLARIEQTVSDLAASVKELAQALQVYQQSSAHRPAAEARTSKPDTATNSITSEWPLPSEVSSIKPVHKVTTVWGRQLDEAVKSAGLVERLNLRPTPATARPTSYETLIMIGVPENGRTLEERKSWDKEAARKVLNAIGVDKSVVLSTYRFNPPKVASQNPTRSLHQPIRVQLTTKAAVSEALRRAHRLQGTQFGDVFLRRDLSKEDKELDVIARKTRDERNKELEAANINHLKFVVPSSGKVGQIVLIDATKPLKSDAVPDTTTTNSATAATPSQADQHDDAEPSTSGKDKTNSAITDSSAIASQSDRSSSVSRRKSTCPSTYTASQLSRPAENAKIVSAKRLNEALTEIEQLKKQLVLVMARLPGDETMDSQESDEQQQQQALQRQQQ